MHYYDLTVVVIVVIVMINVLITQLTTEVTHYLRLWMKGISKYSPVRSQYKQIFNHIQINTVQYPPQYDISHLSFADTISDEIKTDINSIGDEQLAMMQLVMELYIQQERTLNAGCQQDLLNALNKLKKWVQITKIWIRKIVEKYPPYIAKNILYILRPNMSKQLYLSSKPENTMYINFMINGKVKRDTLLPARDLPALIYNKFIIFAGYTSDYFLHHYGYQSPKQLQVAYFSVIKFSVYS